MGEVNQEQQGLNFREASNFVTEYLVTKGFNNIHAVVAFLEVLKLELFQQVVFHQIQQAQQAAQPTEAEEGEAEVS